METTKSIVRNFTGKSILSGNLILMVLLFMFSTQNLTAHCDRENGPVAMAAKEALKTGDFEKIVIWVGEEQEQELEEKFRQSLAVYKQGGEAEQLSKQFFMETAVRLHREAEGMPFTGLKPASPNPPDIEAAENALETGDLDPVITLLSNKMEKETSISFQKAIEAKKNKEQGIASGREWVDNYVKYITYIHKLYQVIEAGPPHGVDGSH
mgnify:CR=1 FL=1